MPTIFVSAAGHRSDGLLDSLAAKGVPVFRMEAGGNYDVILGGMKNNKQRRIVYDITAVSYTHLDVYKRQVLMSAWEKAEINPEELVYIEAHGTGTQLGDPIEINALTKAFSESVSYTHLRI